MTLPLEVRYLIFDQLMLCRHTIVLSPHRTSHGPLAPFFLICRQINQEVTQWLQGRPELVKSVVFGVIYPEATTFELEMLPLISEMSNVSRKVRKIYMVGKDGACWSGVLGQMEDDRGFSVARMEFWQRGLQISGSDSQSAVNAVLTDDPRLLVYRTSQMRGDCWLGSLSRLEGNLKWADRRRGWGWVG